MSEWINAKTCKPPVSKSVLLYVVTMHDDLINMWAEEIIVGFWSDEMEDDYEGWYQEMYEHYQKFKQTKKTKVLAWTLLPQPPQITFPNSNRCNDLLEAFKNE